MGKLLVITIDGPAGVGKSTVSKGLAERLSYTYLDTGSLYRAVAYKINKLDIKTADEEALAAYLGGMDIHLDNSGSNVRVLIDQEDVTYNIRTEEIGLSASKVSAIPIVREALLHLQRRIGESGGIVAEGRDMGTVVFPNADVKFFLEASKNERIKRRYDELLLRGDDINLEKLAASMAIRDKQDMERLIAPLTPHPDAVIIDTTSIMASEVVEKMMDIINRHCDRIKSCGND
ncbi:MAG: (d)CMP kinase [Syntrophales bacterium]|nr:(d)CMP kinase [Syntrophales bacterium]